MWNMCIPGLAASAFVVAPNKPEVNWFANSNCQYAFLNSHYGPGGAPLVSHFSILSFTPLASGPSANSSDTVIPTIETEGAKWGTELLLKIGGAGAESLQAWGAATLIPTLMGTAMDAQAKYACRDVNGYNTQGW
jgi:hypothetical protein